MAGKLKKLTQDQVGEAVRLYDGGSSLADIAPLYGVSRQSMHDLLKRRTEMRPRARHGEENHFYRGGATSVDPVHNLVEKAIARGDLTREACESCGCDGTMSDGRALVQAHHDDYNKPLDVRWLCQPCHHEWHKTNTATPRKENEEVPSADLWCGGFP